MSDWRNDSIQAVRINAVWLGEFLLVSAPLAIIALMVLATMSFVLGAGIATDRKFEMAWSWASALAVDGVMLALIIRAARPAKSAQYVVTLITLVPMIAIGIALLALVTYQQITGLTSERLAIAALGIPVMLLVLGRAGLTMFSALVGLVFSHHQHKDSTLAQPSTKIAQPHAKLADKDAILALIRANPSINLKELAQETGIAYSTLTSWKRALTKEQST